MVNVKEESHENKLTYRHFKKIDKPKEGFVNIIKPDNKVSPNQGYTTRYPQILGISSHVFVSFRSGQNNSGCNSAIRSDFQSIQSGNANYKRFRGIVLYLPLGKVLRNTGTKDMKAAIAYIKKYIKLLKETGVMFGIECLGEVHSPNYQNVNKKGLTSRIKEMRLIRPEKVLESSTNAAIGLNDFCRSIQKDTDLSLEKRWIGVSIDFDENILSPAHALAQATAIRYLFFNRYRGIVRAFVKISKDMPELNRVQALSLAHYWCEPIGSPYSAYYGLMPTHDLLSFADGAKHILAKFKNGAVINEAFANYSKMVVISQQNVFGESYDTTNSKSSKVLWENTMLPLVKKNDYKGAFNCINKWVNDKN